MKPFLKACDHLLLTVTGVLGNRNMEVENRPWQEAAQQGLLHKPSGVATLVVYMQVWLTAPKIKLKLIIDF